jgi:hypothetical protein
MVDPISIASGAITLATFAFECSVSLYQAVESFRTSQKTIRRLGEELIEFQRVTESLKSIASADESRFDALRLTLLHCGRDCKGLEKLIADCSKHSDSSKPSIRDWTKLQYRKESISEFTDKLAMFRGTISIAVVGEIL